MIWGDEWHSQEAMELCAKHLLKRQAQLFLHFPEVFVETASQKGMLWGPSSSEVGDVSPGEEIR